jgi:hypothetical protein
VAVGDPDADALELEDSARAEALVELGAVVVAGDAVDGAMASRRPTASGSVQSPAWRMRSMRCSAKPSMRARGSARPKRGRWVSETIATRTASG